MSGWFRVVVQWVRGGLVAGLVAAGVVVQGASPGAAADAGQAEADLAYHGAALMSAGRVDVRFVPRNHGPADVSDATVRLTWSAPLADRQELPAGCARSGERVLLCRTGALAAGEVGQAVGLRVWLRAAPTEVLMEFDTVWGGGAVDRNRDNDRQRVLVLDTGDTYYF
ncbi:hypothetical protein ACFRI7_03400 [Streptomyces sp. NPDC056716]|uniref:hypothetical protein n=1 Tax=unclassified Streptomyces TaxID=2593676 RepID=UPI003685D42A